jgi:hydrogenase maturation protease
MTSTAKLLVIGYGNTLRGDDGVGPRVAEAVERLQLPGVRTLICQQLSPEHAEMISQAERVVFVDAAVDGPKEVQLRELVPGDTTRQTRARCWHWLGMFSVMRPKRGG